MNTKVRTDELRPGDVILDGSAWLKIIQVSQEPGVSEIVDVTSEIRGWGVSSRQNWSALADHEFTLVERKENG